MIAEAPAFVHQNEKRHPFIYTPPPPNFLADQRLVEGWNVEQRIAEVLTTAPIVNSVLLAERNSADDAAMIDMFVRLKPDYMIPSFDFLKVQAKSSRWGVKKVFRRKIDKFLDGDDTKDRGAHRTLWIKQNGFIVLNGGVKGRKDTGEPIHVTNEDILQSFAEQYREIRDFHLLFDNPVNSVGN